MVKEERHYARRQKAKIVCLWASRCLSGPHLAPVKVVVGAGRHDS